MEFNPHSITARQTEEAPSLNTTTCISEAIFGQLCIGAPSVREAATIREMRRRTILESCSGFYPEHLVEDYANCDSVELVRAAIHSGDIQIARVGDEIAGYVWISSRTGHLCELIVYTEHQRQGIGSILLEAGLCMIGAGPEDPVTIYATYNARDFYRSRGFEEVGSCPAEDDAKINLPVIEMTRHRKRSCGRS